MKKNNEEILKKLKQDLYSMTDEEFFSELESIGLFLEDVDISCNSFANFAEHRELMNYTEDSFEYLIKKPQLLCA